MNDTESDARRLMTTATSDMPDEIDLLGGFARLRSRRRRGRAVATAGVAVTAAAAAGIALTVGSAPALHAVRPGAPAHAAGPARSALTAVTTALNNTVSTQSFREVEESSVQTIFYDGKTTPTYRTTCTGEEDAAAGLVTSYCSGAGDFITLEAGGWVYNSDLPVSSAYDYKPWLRIKSSELGSIPFSSPIANASEDPPQQILSAIEKGAKVTTAGPASGPGWTGTRYTFTWSKIPAKGLKPDIESGSVDVDQQGRTRVLEYNDRLTAADGTVVVRSYGETFSDFGVKVTVQVPPANQVYTQNPYYRGNRKGPSR